MVCQEKHKSELNVVEIESQNKGRWGGKIMEVLNDCGFNKNVKWLVLKKYVELVRTFHSFIQIYMGVNHRVTHTDGLNEDQILK